MGCLGSNFDPSRFGEKRDMPADLKAPRRVRCPKCNGTGQRIEHALTVRRCRTCEGRGRILADHKIDLTERK